MAEDRKVYEPEPEDLEDDDIEAGGGLGARGARAHGDDDLDDPLVDADLEDEDEEEEEEESEDDEALSTDDDGESDSTSLEELLAQRAAARRGGDDSDDETDIMSFGSEPDRRVNERLSVRVTPMKDRQEFVCKRCFLVKPRVQLADPERGLCRDCV